MLVKPEVMIAKYVEEEDGKDLERDWTNEDSIPTEDIDEELHRDREEREEVLADENLHVVF